jgi:hypothetical protein
MNTKAMSMEILPVMNAATGTGKVATPTQNARLVLLENLAERTECFGRLGAWPYGPTLGKRWETLSYLILWGCGWLGVALCLL